MKPEEVEGFLSQFATGCQLIHKHMTKPIEEFEKELARVYMSRVNILKAKVNDLSLDEAWDRFYEEKNNFIRHNKYDFHGKSFKNCC